MIFKNTKIFILLLIAILFLIKNNETFGDSVTYSSSTEYQLGTTTNTDYTTSDGYVILSASSVQDWSSLTPASSPTAREYHLAVYDEDDDRIWIIFGDDGSTQMTDIAYYYTSSNIWVNVTPDNSGPTDLTMSSGCYFPGLQQLVVFGGNDGTQAINETWSFNIQKNQWLELNPSSPPPARYGHNGVYLKEQDKFVIFGGFDGTDYLDDTWSYDFRTNTWTQITTYAQPDKRGNYGMTASNDKLYLFGGEDASTSYDDLWEFDLDTELWTELIPQTTTPPQTSSPAISFDFASNGILLFGGVVASVQSDQTYFYDLINNDWTLVSPSTTPDARYGHSLLYSPNTNTHILFGGFDGSIVLNNQFAYSNASFTSSGTFESAVIDAGANVYWEYISWNGITPNGTNIKAKVRTSSDGSTWTSWSSISDMVSSDGAGINEYAQYAQFMLTLNTYNPNVTPFLDSVILNYSDFPTQYITGQNDFELAQVSNIEVASTPGSAKLTFSSLYGIFSGLDDSGGDVFLSKYVSSAWQSTSVEQINNAIQNITNGDVNNDSYEELYVLDQSNNIAQLSYSQDKDSWLMDYIAVEDTPWSAAVGDGDNDNLNELFVVCRSNATENLLMFKFYDSYYERTVIDTMAAGGEWIQVADGNNDSVNELYVYSTDGNIYQYVYSASTWSSTIVGTAVSNSNNTQCFSVGDGNNDNDNEVYAVTTGPSFTLVEYKWNSGTTSWDTANLGDLSTPGSVIVGDANNDSSNEVIASALDPNDIVMYTYSSGWSSTTISSTITSTITNLIIQDADNNGNNEIIGIDGSDTIYITSYSNSVWATTTEIPSSGKNISSFSVSNIPADDISYDTPGYILSPAINANETVHWVSISWSYLANQDMSLEIKTRTGDTNDPDDGSWSSWSSAYSNSGGDVITSDDSQYIQVMAKLETSNPIETPSLKYLILSYTHFPDKPVNTLPINTSTVNTSAVTLQASDFVDSNELTELHSGSQWLIRLDSANYGDTNSYDTGEIDDLTTFSIPSGALINGNIYYWKVRYKDENDGWSPYSDETSFRYYVTQATSSSSDNNPPITPSNWSPLEDEDLELLTPTLISSTFSDVDDGDTHLASQWQIRTQDTSYEYPVYDSGITSDNLVSITVPEAILYDGQTYYWHVRYQDSNEDWSEYSAETSFNTDLASLQYFASIPGIPESVSPTSGSSGHTSSVTLQWTEPSGNSPIYYHLQVSLYSDFSELLIDGSPLTDTSFEISTLDNSTIYYWRVMAFNTIGESDWSQTFNFSSATSSPAGRGGCFIKYIFCR